MSSTTRQRRIPLEDQKRQNQQALKEEKDQRERDKIEQAHNENEPKPTNQFGTPTGFFGSTLTRNDGGAYWWVIPHRMCRTFTVIFTLTFLIWAVGFATLHFLSLPGYTINWLDDVTGGLTEWRSQSPPDQVTNAAVIGGSAVGTAAGLKNARGIYKAAPVATASKHFTGLVTVGKNALT